MSKNIIIFNNRLLPYSETFILSQAERYREFRPIYIGCRRVKDLPTPEDRTVVLNNGTITGALRETAFKLCRNSRHLRTHISQLDAKLIHAHFGPNGVRILPVANELQIPLIVTFHGTDATLTEDACRRSSYGLGQYVRYRSALQKGGSLFIAVSHFIHSKLTSCGYNPDLTVTHYIGVDTELFSCRTDVQRQPVVLFIGRLIENKGCQYLIEAMGKIQQFRPEVKLVVVGDGPLRQELHQQASGLSNVQFVGIQAQSEVRRWLRTAKLLCVPSVTLSSGASEGLPTVIAEAYAMGLPVVATSVAGIPEIVVDGQTGFLVPERDAEALAHRIMVLLSNADCWNYMSRAARDRVRMHFDLGRQTLQLERLYSELLGRDGAR